MPESHPPHRSGHAVVRGAATPAVVRTSTVRTVVVRVVVVVALLAVSGFAWAPGPWRTGRGPAFDVPTTEFRQTMGYAPVAAPGRPDVLLSPRGECSVPTGGTLFGFDEACREHDLAYDVLRFHEARGELVDPRLRWSADVQFGLRMVERCVERGSELGACLAAAGAYTAGVTVNSARQLYGAPADESGLQVAGSTLTMIGLVALLLGPTTAARGFRRMLRMAELDLVAPPAWSGWSGASGSLVRWADLGREGRRLLARAPVAPGALRVVVGLESARRLDRRVELALAEAERVGAFTRGTVCVATPTGCGWLNPAAVEGLERATGGDVATITVPYAAAPSWLSALAHPGAHRRASVALLRAVHARWSQIPAEVRPRLVVLGESLGANGMAAALRRLPQVRADVDGGLLVGGVRSAWWEPLGRVAFVRHDDDPVVRLGVRTLHLLPSAGGAPEGHGHHYGAELDEAWRANLAGGVGAGAGAGAGVGVGVGVALGWSPGEGGRGGDGTDGGTDGRTGCEARGPAGCEVHGRAHGEAYGRRDLTLVGRGG